MKRVLLIGYGNALRGDDGLGQRIAHATAFWGWPGLTVRAATQLTPELAADVAASEIVIFVDAAHDPEHRGVDVREVLPADAAQEGTNHFTSPEAILSLAASAYGAHPVALLMTIPGHDFSIGTQLSPEAEADMMLALNQLRVLLAELSE